jgi:hypothetical protein
VVHGPGATWEKHQEDVDRGGGKKPGTRLLVSDPNGGPAITLARYLIALCLMVICEMGLDILRRDYKV